MFKKKKTDTKPENTAPAEETGEVKIKKDIKLLWIYTALFCLFALLLIIASSIIQGKMNSEADYYQDLYEGEKTTSQSTIKNIQTENTALKNANETYKKENKELTEKLETSVDTINTAAELAESYEYFILAQKEANSGNKTKAKEYYAKIDSSVLSQELTEIYEKLGKTLGI